MTEIYASGSGNYNGQGIKHEEIIMQLNSIIDSIPGDIYWKDTDGVWIGLNKNCLESLLKMQFIKKNEKSEIIGKTDYDIFNKETADEYRKNDLKVMQNRISLTYEEKTKLPSGETIYLLSTKNPFLNELGEVIGIIGNTIDITARKKIELELKIAKNLSDIENQTNIELLETMQCDIKNKLNSIISFTKLIKAGSSDQKIQKYANSLVYTSQSLLSIIERKLK